MRLFRAKPDIDAVHLLADHLEAVLGLTDELKACSYVPHAASLEASSAQILDDLARLSTFVERLQTIELAIATKLGHARKSADRLARSDAKLKPFAMLFLAGTAALSEALPRITDPSEDIFNHSDQPITFLKRRAMLLPERGTIEGIASLRPDGGYLLLSLVALGALVELIETSLTTLDTHYGIYELETAAELVAEPAEPLPDRLSERLKRIVQS